MWFYVVVIIIIVVVQIALHFYGNCTRKFPIVLDKINKQIISIFPNDTLTEENISNIPKLLRFPKSNDQKKTSILFIGKTGTGKSTLVELLSGHPTIHNSGHRSIQTEPEIFEAIHQDVNNYNFIDTPGFQASDMTPDEVLRYKIIYKMQQNNINHIKIIWCAEPRIRSDQDFKRDCEFIQNLGNNKNDEKIWNSMLIIEKEPRFINRISTGVLGACYDQDCMIFGGNDATKVNNNHDHYTGITCIDWVEDDEAKNNMLQSKLQIMSPSVIRETVLNKLNNLPSYEITYVIQQCEKCNQMFLKNYPSPNCHDNYYEYHDMPNNYTHPNQEFHPGKITDNVIKLTFIGAIILAGLGPAISWALPFLYICGATAGTSLVGAVGGFLVGANKKRWDCCNELEGKTKGCMKRYKCCLQNVGPRVPLKNNCIKICKHCEKPYHEKPCGRHAQFKHKIIEQNG